MRTTLKWLAAALSLVLAGCASAQQFSFALIGDMGYRASEEPQLENVLREVNAAPLAFVAHVGDLGSPAAGSCTDELLAKRLAQFQALAHPLIYTPGDNEWTDCHDGQGVKGGNPLQRLPVVRGMFFKDEQSLGQRKLPLVRQAGITRENARWEMGGVVARLGGVGEEVPVAILELEILDSPGTPEGFDLGFGKFHGLVRQNAQGAYRLGKRCRAHFFPGASAPDVDASLWEARPRAWPLVWPKFAAPLTPALRRAKRLHKSKKVVILSEAEGSLTVCRSLSALK
jgi:hypothetical protein